MEMQMPQGKVGRKYGHAYYKDNDVVPTRIRSSFPNAYNDYKYVIGGEIVKAHDMSKVRERIAWNRQQKNKRCLEVLEQLQKRLRNSKAN